MPISELNKEGELHDEEHEATLQEITRVYGALNNRRNYLMSGLHQAALNLSLAGAKRIRVKGSFIADKAEPNDTDGCWNTHHLLILKNLIACFKIPGK